MDKWETITTAKARLGVPESTLRQACIRGAVQNDEGEKAIKLGNQWLIPPDGEIMGRPVGRPRLEV